MFSPQINSVTVGFISVSADVDLKQLRDSFDLSEISGLCKPDAACADGQEVRRIQSSASQQVTGPLTAPVSCTLSYDLLL